MTAYHPQSDGEWRGGTECSYQCCERLSRSWEDYVRPIRMAYNTSRVYSPLPNVWKTSETSDGADVWNTCYSQVQNMPPNIKSSLSHMRRWRWQPLGNLTMKRNFTTREAIWSGQSYMGFIATSTQRKVKTVPPMIKHLTYRVQDIHNQRKRMVVHFNPLKPHKQWVQTQVKDKAACM